jgi:hypothetical protein
MAGLLAGGIAQAQDIVVPIGEFKVYDDDWIFTLGPEYPGALGSATIDHKTAKTPGGTSLKITADLSDKNSRYVAVVKDFDNLPVRTIGGWYRSDGVTSLGMRVIDSTGQCFQSHVAVQDGKTWEKLDIAIDDLLQSEHWGGKNDGAWHGPLKAISIGLGGLDPAHPVGTLWLESLTAGLTPGSTRPAPRGTPKAVMIEDFETGVDGWTFLNGQEFPGATGFVEVSKKAHDGKVAMNMDADFRAGGAYIGAHRKDIPEVPGQLLAIMLWVKADGVDSMNCRLIDSDGQVFQGKNFPIMPGKDWQELTLHMKDLVTGEHWGGKNDGTFRPPVTQMTLTVGAKGVDQTAKKGTILFDSVRFVAIPDKSAK